MSSPRERRNRSSTRSALRQTVVVMDHNSHEVVGHGYCYYVGTEFHYDLYSSEGHPLPVALYEIRVTGELEIVVMPRNIQ